MALANLLAVFIWQANRCAFQSGWRYPGREGRPGTVFTRVSNVGGKPLQATAGKASGDRSFTEPWKHVTEAWKHVTEGWKDVTEAWKHDTEGWKDVTEPWKHDTEGWKHVMELWKDVTEAWKHVTERPITSGRPCRSETGAGRASISRSDGLPAAGWG